MTTSANLGAAGHPHTPLDSSVAHPARRYNYWLGAKDNFGPDRESGDRIAKQFPHVVDAARENRACLGRAVQFLAEEGIRRWVGHQARFQVRS